MESVFISDKNYTTYRLLRGQRDIFYGGILCFFSPLSAAQAATLVCQTTFEQNMSFYWKFQICVNANRYEQRINIKWLITIVSAASPASKDKPSILYKFTKRDKS